MTQTEARPGAGAPPEDTFVSTDPRTGEVLGTYPVQDIEAVGAVVARARDASAAWREVGFAGRRQVLGGWRRLIVRRLEEAAALISAETGKPADDARLELVLVVDHLAWAARNAERVLGPRRVNPGLLMVNQTASVHYVPFGVVGVIGPWNYPAFTPMGSIGYALAAGNAVVFKPSELTPGVGKWLADSFAEASGRPDLFGVVTGFGHTGAALCRAGVDKLAFTGSTDTGKRVMAACAETLTPVLVECGGKDPMIVTADADLDAAADAAVWGGMANAGQTCVGVERIYVVDEVAAPLLDRITKHASVLRPGANPRASFGPMTRSEQADVVRCQVEDALVRGARAAVGGVESVRPPFVEPVVLVDVPEDAPAVTEETFGPTLTVNRVADLDEAIAKANATSYGLGATVFASPRLGEEVARRLRSGMVAVNSVISFTAVPALPFGGVGDSGFGRIHGDDGLREFARPQAITRQRFRSPIPVATFSRGPGAMRRLVRLVRLRYGR